MNKIEGGEVICQKLNEPIPQIEYLWYVLKIFSG